MDNEEIKTNNDDQEIKNQSEDMDKAPISSKSKLKPLIVIVLVAIAVILAAGYFIYEKKDAQKAQFFISNSEISDAQNVVETSQFVQGNNIYFFFNLKRNVLNAEVCILEIEYKKEDVFSYYKKITFEIGREFPYLNSFIPSVYFTKSGNYNIKVILDGRLVAERQISIGAR